MKITVRIGFVLMTLALAGFQAGVKGEQCVLYYEEGSSQSITCGTSDTFAKYGPRIEINQTFQETIYCDSNCNCHTNDPARYSPQCYKSGNRTNVTAHVNAVERSMTRVVCYRNDVALYNVYCLMRIYIKPSKPVCSDPQFVDGGSAVLLTCTSNRVFPSAFCGVVIRNETGELFQEKHRLSFNASQKSSDQYPGDFSATCDIRMQLPGVAENVYQIAAFFAAGIPEYASTAVLAGKIQLDLRATSLVNPLMTRRQVTFDPDIQELKLDIAIISNPPPYEFSLSVSQDESVTPVSVPSGQFSVEYNSDGGSDYKGTLSLAIKSAVLADHRRFSHFTFTASNGVRGASTFIDKFTYTKLDVPPTQPTCDAPVFLEDGLTALIACKADGVHPDGTCSFTPTASSPSLRILPKIETKINTSKAYPGEMEVSCELRFAAAGNGAGLYQFQVAITPSGISGNQAVVVTTPTLNIAPIRLYSPEDNHHVFKYPPAGVLSVSTHVTGNPAPNWVSLWVRKSHTSQSVPMTSREYQWTYTKLSSAASDSGVIQVEISGGLEQGEITSFTLKATNGVLDDGEFEYKFSVNDVGTNNSPQKEDDNDNLPIIVGAAAGGLALLLIIIVIIVCMRRRRSSEPDYFDRPHASPDSFYIYPNMGYEAGTGEGPYSQTSKPSMTVERPVSENSLPEYSELYDIPSTDNQRY
ncbi:hypothetical protein EGW08_013323 [Elysia chlorotica]|uniref:Uncharacterized protein n=1 Tax=Elysia chlorotica TaxID=188477 RepID=A0A3S0ZZC6_ELYCH|nr:hypothetical protein EGW08_013323 [Elysia chlorotica]